MNKIDKFIIISRIARGRHDKSTCVMFLSFISLDCEKEKFSYEVIEERNNR